MFTAEFNVAELITPLRNQQLHSQLMSAGVSKPFRLLNVQVKVTYKDVTHVSLQLDNYAREMASVVLTLALTIVADMIYIVE